MAFNIGDSATEVMRLDSTGFVGIGVSTPSTILDVRGEGNFSGSVYYDNDTLVGSGGGAPSGMVSFFDLGSCPDGWHELTTLRGVYPVGLPSGGTHNATVGTALSNSENRPVGLHLHASPHNNFIENYLEMNNIGGTGVLVGMNNAANTANEGNVAGTNAPYLQLLACVKE